MCECASMREREREGWEVDMGVRVCIAKRMLMFIRHLKSLCMAKQ